MAKAVARKPVNITEPSGRTKIVTADREMLFEQYKLFVDSADKISERRLAASSFFLTVNTAIIGASGFPEINAGHINFAGIILCVAWYTLIKSYKRLNGEKFKIIHDMEKLLPKLPFKDEWDALGQVDNNRRSYKQFSDVERWVPIVFGGLHLWLFLSSVMPFVVKGLQFIEKF